MGKTRAFGEEELYLPICKTLGKEDGNGRKTARKSPHWRNDSNSLRYFLSNWEPGNNAQTRSNLRVSSTTGAKSSIK